MIIALLLLINLVLILSSPKFGIIDEDNSIIYLSSHGYYQIVFDEFTLTYLSGLYLNNLTRIPSNVLKQYDRLPDIPSLTILRNWDDATDRISTKLKLIQDEPDLIADHVFIGAICNPSVIYFHGRHLVAGRRIDWKPLVVFAWLRSSDFVIDNSDKYLGIGPGLTTIDNDGINDFGEDPRLVVVDNDTFLMIRTDGSSRPFQMRLSFIKYDSNVEKLVQLNDTIVLPPNFESMNSQKNWSPFFYQSQLMFVYQLHDSLIIIRQKTNALGHTEVVSDVSNNGRVSSLWEYGQIRGGSPARRVGNRFLSFFHSQLPTVGTGMYWHSMYMGAYLFSGVPPFKLLSMSRVPIYNDGWFTGPWMKAYQTLYVYFAVNFYFIDVRTGKILENIDEDNCELDCMKNYNVSLSYGFNDVQGYVGLMNLATLFQTLHHFDSGDVKNDFLTFPNSTDFHFDSHTKFVSVNHTEKVENSYPQDHCGLQNQYSVVTDVKSLITDRMRIVETSSLLPVQFKVVTRDNPADIVKWIDDDIAHYDLISWHFKWLEEHVSNQEHEKTRTFHCLDFGGNHGFYSWYLAKHNCTVEMFEVQLDLVEVNKATVHINNLHDKVLIHNLGLSDTDSKMHINGVGGIAFLTPDPTSTSYTVNVSSADKCLYHRARHFAFVKIDVEGFEVRALHGFNWTVSNTVVEAFLIEVGPKRWNRADITVEEGSNMMLSILSSRFLCYIIVRNADSCPSSVYPSTSEYDILLSGASILKRVPWNKFTDLMVAMAKDDYDCNFFVLHHSHSLVQRLQTVPYTNNIEGKFIRGSSGRAIYLLENGKLRDIPNMDTLEKLQQTNISKEIIVISNSKISALPVGIPIPPA